MAKEKKEDTIEEKPKFKYTPFVDSDTLPECKTDKKGNFVSYGEPHYAYRRSSPTTVEFLAYFRKPKGVVSKLVRVLRVRSGKNADDAFFRLLKDNHIPEID